MPIVVSLSNAVTNGDIISRAMRLSGSLAGGETLDASQAADGLVALNSMLEVWALEKLMLFKFETIAFKPVTNSFTIGPTGDVVTLRPVEIQSAYRTSGGVDLPIDVISREQYESITLKGQASPTSAVYYKPEFPNGRVLCWPVNGVDTLNLTVQQPLLGFTSITDVMNLPPGYQETLTFNLAVTLAPEFNTEVSRTVMRQAMNTKRLIKTVNNEIPMLSVDPALSGGVSTQWWTPA